MDDHVNKAEEVIMAATGWADAICTADAATIVGYYDEHAVLWGTLSQVRRDNPDSIRQYFDRLTTFDELKVEFFDSLVRIYGDIAINSGSYTFSWRELGTRIVVPARFSFVYRNVGNRWIIIDHHSSVVPDSPFDPFKYRMENNIQG